jgi:hypothetical protein
MPGVLAPGTYQMTLEMDVYVYKDPASSGDPFSVGNRVYVLTDEDYDSAEFHFDSGDPAPGFREDFWPAVADDETENGVWRHVVLEREVSTTSGNIEMRLLMHDKIRGKQAVAWDNVRLTVGLPCWEPRFDRDNDGDVDQDDFAVFQVCFTGGVGSIVDPDTCRCMNSDGDEDIDQIDLIGFEACARGPMIEADDTCDDLLAPP